MGLRILIADDSLTVRMDLAEAFEAAGFTPVACATLSGARSELQRGDIALAVLDVRLPDGDGVEFLRELRGKPSLERLPVLLLSNEAEVHHRLRGLSSGADDYVGKPYDRASVVTRARLLLGVAAAPAPTGESAPSRLLVIDDSPTFREGLAEVLTDSGYSVETAATGEEGLRIVAAHRPTAVIVDGVLPDIPGATVIRRMRLDSALRGTPCLLVTADEHNSAEIAALEAGADAFLRKNESIDVIRARIVAVLRGVVTQRSAEVGPLRSRRVLAVDEIPEHLNALADALRPDGYDVVLARAGDEACELLAVQAIDCIVLGAQLDGSEARAICRRVKASPGICAIPVILLTPAGVRQALLEGLTAGADDCVEHTGDFVMLSARVRVHLRRRQLEEEHRRHGEALRRVELQAADDRAARKVAETKAGLSRELTRKNEELELLTRDLALQNAELDAFSSAASHDLRARLRGVWRTSERLIATHADKLEPNALEDLTKLRGELEKMDVLIDDLLRLSRVSLAELQLAPTDLSQLARAVVDRLGEADPERRVEVVLQPGLVAHVDPGLVRSLLENLLENAWKYSAKSVPARIELGGSVEGGELVCFVRDNGVGFDMAFADKLFKAFQRLHGAAFPGTGVGLATVRRIAERHRGRVWAESTEGKGTTIRFALPSTAPAA